MKTTEIAALLIVMTGLGSFLVIVAPILSSIASLVGIAWGVIQIVKSFKRK